MGLLGEVSQWKVLGRCLVEKNKSESNSKVISIFVEESFSFGPSRASQSPFSRALCSPFKGQCIAIYNPLKGPI